jgi:hypothetical protein
LRSPSSSAWSRRVSAVFLFAGPIAFGVLLSACNSPTTPTTSSRSQSPSQGTHVVAGVVREIASQGAIPVAGAIVYAWVQQSRMGFNIGSQPTDAGGHYRFVDVPSGILSLLASKSGYDQPCAATVDSADATVDIDLVPQNSPSPLLMGGSPTLSGVVFETTSEGRQPVAGASMTLSWYGDVDFATTTSDANGRYLLCRFPAGMPTFSSAVIWANKSGYKEASRDIQIQTDTVLDLELKR